jgi:ABC-type multidrug transport system fused ATPase/permease subunit
MNKLKFILYFIDGIISFITIILGITFIISHVTKPPYGIGETIITLAIMFAILYFTNKTIIKKVRNANENIEEKEEENQENAGEFKEIKENIQAENKDNRPEIAEEQEYEQENENEKRPLNKWLRNIITISVILFSAIVLIYILATYPEKLKMPYSVIAILIPIFVFLAIVMMILRWHQKQADLYEGYHINNKSETSKDNKNNEKNEEIDNENKEIEEENEKDKYKRILITDDSWKKFNMPIAEGHPFSNYTEIGASMFLDVSRWDVHALFKEFIMFDPSLKNDKYFNHKLEMFMKMNDRDYRHSRVSQSDFLRPEEILIIKMDKTQIERDNENADEYNEIDNEDNENRKRRDKK